MWTLQAVLNWTKDYFDEHQIETARLDAELLIAHVCQCQRIDLYLNHDKPLSQEERATLRELVKQRAAGQPIAYLIGTKEFWSLSLLTRPGALIPRPDTEILVEVALDQIRAWQSEHPDEVCQILEFGTGTAAIPLAICSELQRLEVVSLEKSADAYQVAQENLKTHAHLMEPQSNRLQLLLGKTLSELPKGHFDFILSNPPYIPSEEVAHLQKEVAEHEPHMALDGGKDGMDYYRYLLKEGEKNLKASGQWILEMGYDQENAMQALAVQQSIQLLKVHPDLQGHPRVVHLSR